MKKKAAFTLVELLAVVVILTIILLLVTPMVIGHINNTKKDSMINTFNNMINAVILDSANNSFMTNKEYIIKDSKITVDGNSIKMDGLIIGNGKIIINELGNPYLKIEHDNWCATKEYNDELTVTKGKCN